MSMPYRVMYRLGLTPWTHADPPPILVDLIEGPGALPPGRLLDIGCGTGGDAVYCARHKWDVTGVDAVQRAVEAARRNAADAGVEARFLHADITKADDLGTGYTLLLDGGCLHGLAPTALRAAVSRISAAAEPGATLVMLAFAPARRGPLPRGLDAAEVRAAFAGWDLTVSRPADDVRIPVRNADASWHVLTRH
jgi:SAM-dependent methyltransferase